MAADRRKKNSSRHLMAMEIPARRLKEGTVIVEKSNAKTFEYHVKEVLPACDITHHHVRIAQGPVWCYDVNALVDILV